MSFFCFFTVGLMCFFFREKASYISYPPICSYFSFPASPSLFYPRKEANALKPVFVGSSTVGPILAVCCFSQIFKSIVCFVPIYVIQHFFRKTASHIHPNNSMRGIMFAVYFKINVSSTVKMPGFGSNLNFGARRFPIQASCLWIVIKNLGEFFMGNHESNSTRFRLRLHA